MLFNSWIFLLFLLLFFVGYWFVFAKKVKLQNAFIAISSFIFYGWWDWHFLLLLLLSVVVDFSVGYFLEQTNNEPKRKALIVFSVVFNIGLLMFFKYYNFFAESAKNFAASLGFDLDIVTLKIILPVGISFYTFQSLSYTIEVYKRKLKGTSDIFSYAAFISFFPQLVAGPIERAANMLPQFYKPRTFSYANNVKGLRLILWGLFKKVVVADTCAGYANSIFNNQAQYHGIFLIMGAIYFSFQIYGDFSGYTDIARGLGKMFGFDLKINFMYPYFSRNIAEFWRRWHISLSSWFRDYLYIPLGGSLGSKAKTIRNTLIVFLVSGFWHGANFTFIIWGTIHALCYIPLLIMNKHKSNNNTVAENRSFPSIIELLQMFGTFAIVCLAWIFFRAENINAAFSYIQKIFVFKGNFGIIGKSDALPFIFIMVLVDWIGRKNESALDGLVTRFPAWRYMFYFIIAIMVYLFFSNQQEFIYFQF